MDTFGANDFKTLDSICMAVFEKRLQMLAIALGKGQNHGSRALELKPKFF